MPPVTIHWTQTALEALRRLPKKVGRGLYRKVGELKNSDPKSLGKPLTGPLANHFRLAYSRYRAVYRVDEVKNSRGRSVMKVTVVIVIVGKRKAGDRRDVYELARKLINLGKKK